VACSGDVAFLAALVVIPFTLKNSKLLLLLLATASYFLN
jgi:hypothetical protein